MFRQFTLGLLTILTAVMASSCTMQPPGGGDGGGNGDGNGGGDGGGNGGGGAIGELIGALTVSASRSFSDLADTETVSAGAILASADAVIDDVETKTFDDCIVTTTTIDPDDPVDIPSFEAYDAGTSGTISTSGNEATLNKQAEGIYGNSELAEAGFGPGETHTFTFPGGVDIDGFMTSIDLPAAFTSTTPNLSDDALSIDKSSALNVAWAPSGDADQVHVQITTADMATFVTISCTFDDTGSGTVPADAMECLLDTPTSTTISITRSNANEITVDLTEGGSGTLTVGATTGDSRTIFTGGDTGGIDPCDFITCPEGTTCNPNTFNCE